MQMGEEKLKRATVRRSLVGGSDNASLRCEAYAPPVVTSSWEVLPPGGLHQALKDRARRLTPGNHTLNVGEQTMAAQSLSARPDQPFQDRQLQVIA
jgi:hypothetical protein